MADRPEEKLRSEILQHIHDWIKGGMGEADENTSRIDEMIARAFLKAREEAFEECAKIAERDADLREDAGNDDGADAGVDIARDIRGAASAIRLHSQKGEK